MLALYCNLCSPEGAFSKRSVGNKSSIIRDWKCERKEVVSERTIMTCGLIKAEVEDEFIQINNRDSIV